MSPIAVIWWASMSLIGLIVAAIAWYLMRVRTLTSRGAFECAYRSEPALPWVGGLGVFCTSRVEWYRLGSLSWRPKLVMPRESLIIEEVSPVCVDGQLGVVVLKCSNGGPGFELAVRESSHSAVISWMESAPPVGVNSFL